MNAGNTHITQPGKTASLIRRVLTWAGIIVIAAFASSVSLVGGDGPYTVPKVSRITATLPAFTFQPATHTVCLSRVEEQVGSQVTSRLLCYDATKPTAPPPPPPPPYEPPIYETLVSQLDQGTGELSVTFLGCTEFIEGFYALTISQTVQLDKAGGPASGTLTVTEDFTAPFDCADGTQSTGPVTLTPLAQDHDEDGDGCSDWDELDPAGGSDPFNPFDCGAVGGIAELPEVAGTPLEAADSSGPNAGVLAGVAAVVVTGTVALGGAAWYARRKRVR